MNKKRFSPFLIIFIIVILLALSGGVLYYTKNKAGVIEAEQIKARARFIVSLEQDNKMFDVALFADDEKVSEIPNSYCRAEAGTKNYSGSYQLVSLLNDRVVAKTPLDRSNLPVSLERSFEFAENIEDPSPEKMDTISITNLDQTLVVISQYGSCNGNFIYFYRMDNDGKFYKISIIGNDRSRVDTVFGSPASEGNFVVVTGYDNYMRGNFSDFYYFDGQKLIFVPKP